MTNKEMTITITVTSEEVDAVEDMFWCENNGEQLAKMYPLINSFWMKLAEAFDYYDDVETVPYEVESQLSSKYDNWLVYDSDSWWDGCSEFETEEEAMKEIKEVTKDGSRCSGSTLYLLKTVRRYGASGEEML